jgi:hypothetical protein
MPSARTISALRCVASASTCRCAFKSDAALVAPREIRSVTSVMAMIAAVPSSAVKPISGWNRNSPIRKTGNPRHIEERRRPHA